MRRLLLFGFAVLLLLAVPAQAAPAPKIKVLSGRADLTSAGDALVAIDVPSGADLADVRVRLGKRNVTSLFAKRANGRFEGLLTGIPDGRRYLSARIIGGPASRIRIVGHPNGGPVFSGPQVQPWVCQETAKDAKCNEPAKYEFQYRSSGGTFSDYDPANPPSNVATTTTDQGRTVPYIVRIETGYQNRNQYRIAILYDPAKPFRPWAPQSGWNHKLLITHGASCGIKRQAGEAPDVMSETALSRGLAVMSTALNNAGDNCNIVTQAESLVMAKERVVEQHGRIRYTIGTGCSGGSLTQQQVANAYPGIYQGILPACSFPDAWSTGQQLASYHLTRAYFEHSERWTPGIAWTPTQIGDVEGHPNHGNAIILDQLYWTDLGVPDDGCAGVPDEMTYDPESNPDGVRCTLADYMINVLGPRRKSVWGPNEKKLGRGFAGLPLSGVGVQFGLRPLRQGKITPAQFVDLNERIGGFDIDIRATPERNEADDPALKNAYRSGAINETNNLAGVPIIDLRGPDAGAFHDAYRSFTMRARLERQQKRFPRNHVIWFGTTPLIGSPTYESEAIVAIDRWLAKVEADKRKVSRARKVADNRPPDIQDRCTDLPGFEQVTVPGVGKVCENDQVQTRYGTPVTMAGEGIQTDTNRCRLKPHRRLDYYPIAFTDDEWNRLKQAFPTGVCNWSRLGVHQRGAIPWLTYQDAKGRVVYGGKPLGNAPASKRASKKK